MQTAEIYQFPDIEASRTPKGAQLEDGYVRTANAIVEALCKAPLTSREARIVRAVERATFGWDRPSARLSQSALAKMTGLTPKRCSETVNALLAKKVLRRDGGSQAPIGINTRVWEWNFEAQKARVSPKRQQDPTWGLRPQDGDEKRPQDGDTNTDKTDNLEPKGSKDSSEKPASPKHRYDDIDMELAKHMATHVDEITEKTGKHNLKSWANTIRLMRERDGFTGVQIRWLMDWVHADEFWQTNVLSPAKLREKQTQLIAKAKRQHKPARTDGRKGFAQPQAAGTYDTSSNDSLPDWAKGFEQ